MGVEENRVELSERNWRLALPITPRGDERAAAPVRFGGNAVHTRPRYRRGMDVISELFGLRKHFKGSPPGLLYHYTDAVGLLGLLRGETWFTHYSALNDDREGSYFLEVLARWAARGGSARRSPTWLESLLEGGLRIVSPCSTPFVFSLSARGDSLPQWRGYAADGAGYALGFDGPALTAIVRPEPLRKPISQVGCFPVLYDLDEQFAFIDKVAELVPHSPKPMVRTAHAMFIGTLLSPAFKHSAFHDECEWRLVVSCVGHTFAETQDDVEVSAQKWARDMDGWLHFRGGGPRGIVPFLKIPADMVRLTDHVREIHCGPRLHEREARQALEMLLASLNRSAKVKIRFSEVPYR